MNNAKTITLMLAVIMLSAGTLAIFSPGASADDPSYEARVFLDGNEYTGTGSDLVELVKSVAGNDIVMMSNNATILSYKGETAPAGKAWGLFKWEGWYWNVITFNQNSMLVNGAAYAVHLSDIGTSGLVTTYSQPDFKPVATAYFFIQYKEDYNDPYSKDILTETERRNGFWISGTGSNAGDALKNACLEYRFDADIDASNTGRDGWLNSFMGLSDETVGEDYRYWSQYNWNGSIWEFNDSSLGSYDPGVSPYIALVRQTAGDGGADADIAVTPQDVNVVSPYSVWPPSSIEGDHSSTTYGQSGSGVMSESVVSGSVEDGVYKLSEGAVGELIGQLNDVTDVNKNAVMNVTVDAGSSEKVSIPDASEIGDAGADLTVRTSFGEMVLPSGVLSEFGDGTLVLEMKEASADDLSAEQKSKVNDGDIIISISASVDAEDVHELGGKVTVSFPYTVPSGMSISDISLWYMKDDGTLTKMDFTYADGKIFFETDHFSVFKIGSDPSGSTPGGSNGNGDSSGIPMMYIALAAVAVIAIAGAAVFILRR